MTGSKEQQLRALREGKGSPKRRVAPAVKAPKNAKSPAVVERAEVGPAGDDPIVRVIFPCRQSFRDRIVARWHRQSLPSLSETIRVLIDESLEGEGR